MKKNYWTTLICGALLMASAGMMSSCGNDDDVDDLKSRVTVIEGKISEIDQALANAQQTGATITSATQDADGTWTLVLSNGTTVKLTASSGSISVTDNADNMIITINGTEYVIPKGSAPAALIYSPQYEDGIEMVENTDPIDVTFLVSPTISATDVAGATFDIEEAHELKTRAGSSLFKISDQPKLENGFIHVPLKALRVDPGKSYAVSVVMTIGDKQYISNYFRVKVGLGFSFLAEDLVDYNFASSVTDAAKDAETNTWTATLPVDLVDDFNFKDFFTNLPDGATFEIAEQSKQNSDGANQYGLLTSSLKADGSWSLSGRPGTAFNPKDEQPGIVVNVVLNDVIKMKVRWVVVDPLADVNFKPVSFGAYHMEIAGATNDGSDMLNAGENDLYLPKMLTDAAEDDNIIPLRHGDAGKFIKEQWQHCDVTYKDPGDVIFFDGTTYAMGEVGKKFAKNSRGLYWVTYQTSIASSNRRNLADRPADEGSDDNIAWCGGNCNGEIIGGYDGIPGEDMTAFGLQMTSDGHIKTTANYKGNAFRMGVWIHYEYAYGEKELGGNAMAFVWCNRRSCPAGVTDPASR